MSADIYRIEYHNVKGLTSYNDAEFITEHFEASLEGSDVFYISQDALDNIDSKTLNETELETYNALKSAVVKHGDFDVRIY